MIKVTPQEVNFPQALLGLDKPPPFVYLSCSEMDWNGPLIAIVGARDIRPWVKEWMEGEFFPILKKYKLGVISGGARGVDQAAHWLAHRAGVPNIFVIPSGFSKIYPKSLEKFYGRPHCYFVSEYEPEVPMMKYHFYNRNRLIAALAPVTLVVQAQEKSGTMITAKEAYHLGRTVVTLPGSPVDPAFGGNNQLLYDGALMVRNRRDLEQILWSHRIVGFNSNSYEEGPHSEGVK